MLKDIINSGSFLILDWTDAVDMLVVFIMHMNLLIW